MYAIIETGGKQVKCELGKEIYVEKLDVEVGQEFTFNEVLMVSGDDLAIGNPYLKDAKVVCECQKQGRGKKIRVFKYEPKKQFHRMKGHRQAYTKFLVKSIVLKGKVSNAEVKEASQE